MFCFDADTVHARAGIGVLDLVEVVCVYVCVNKPTRIFFFYGCGLMYLLH